MNQLALLFEAPAASPYTVSKARERGEVAGQRAADRAERQDDGFRERARDFVLGYLAQHGISSGELVTDAAKLAGIRPQEDRAFGPVYAGLLRENKVRVVGLAPRRKGHGSLGAKLYELV